MTAAESVLPLPDRASEHFAWSEFRCHDQLEHEYPLDWRISRGVPLALELERIRKRIGPFTPTSVFRSWDHHVAIYARMVPKQTPPPNSGHLAGRAADVPCRADLDWNEFSAAIIGAAHETGSQITYVRLYRHDRFAHVELRPTLQKLKVEYA